MLESIKPYFMNLQSGPVNQGSALSISYAGAPKKSGAKVTTNHACWNDAFEAAFRHKHMLENLPTVLNATGCREGWLQGELYRLFRQSPSIDVPEKVAGEFLVNSYAYSFDKRMKADFCWKQSNGNYAMVGELKVLGIRTYQPKNLYGGGLEGFVTHRGDRIQVTVEVPGASDSRPKLKISGYHDDIAIQKGNSLMMDAWRLTQIVDSSISKFLILVCKTSYGESQADQVGEAIKSLKLKDAFEQTFEFPTYFVRMWRLMHPT